MAISAAVTKGSYTRVYDEQGREFMTLQGTLVGYTSTSITVNANGSMRVYNEKGHEIMTL